MTETEPITEASTTTSTTTTNNKEITMRVKKIIGAVILTGIIVTGAYPKVRAWIGQPQVVEETQTETVEETPQLNPNDWMELNPYMGKHPVIYNKVTGETRILAPNRRGKAVWKVVEPTQ